MTKEKGVAALQAIFTTLAFSMVYTIPNIDLDKNKAPEILINFRMSLSSDYFQMSILAVVLYVLYNKMMQRKKGYTIFKLSCALFALIWVMCYGLSLEDTLDIMYCTKGQILKSIILFIGIASFLYMTGNSFFCFLEWAAKRPQKLMKRSTCRTWGMYTCLTGILWLPHIVLAYPASMCPDSWLQLAMFHGDWTFTEHHTVTHTWLIGIFTLIGKLFHNGNIGLFLFILFQSVIFAMLIGYLLCRMRDLNAPKELLIVTFMATVLSPYYTVYVGVVVKDTLYSYAILLFVIELTYLIGNSKIFWTNNVHKILFMIAIGCSLLFRKNGKFVIIPMLLVITVIIVKQIGWKYKKEIVCRITVLFIPVVFAIAFSRGLTFYYNVEKASMGEAMSLFFQQTARYAREYGEEVTDVERESIDKILDYEMLAESYNPRISDPVKATFRLNEEYWLNDLLGYFKTWSIQLLKHPMCYVSATLKQNDRLFCPNIFNEALRLSTITSNNEYWLNLADSLKIHEIESIEKTKDGLMEWYRIMYTLPGLYLFSSLSIYMYITLFLLMYTLLNKDIKTLIVLFPLILSLIIVILAPCVAARYVFPVIYSVPVVVAYAISSLKVRGVDSVYDREKIDIGDNCAKLLSNEGE